jgi:hypothetical protein
MQKFKDGDVTSDNLVISARFRLVELTKQARKAHALDAVNYPVDLPIARRVLPIDFGYG